MFEEVRPRPRRLYPGSTTFTKYAVIVLEALGVYDLWVLKRALMRDSFASRVVIYSYGACTPFAR
jgi:hypothetical protein